MKNQLLTSYLNDSEQKDRTFGLASRLDFSVICQQFSHYVYSFGKL